MPSESTQDTDRTFRSREDTRQREANHTATPRRLRSPRRSRSMSPKSTVTPLSTASGNSRTRGTGKKSQKVRENEAQKKAGFSVLEDMPDTDVTMIPETQLEPQLLNEASVKIQGKIDALTTRTALFRTEINELNSIHRTEVADLKKIVEQLQIELHEVREQAATTGLVRPLPFSYAATAGSTQGPPPMGPPPIVLPRVEELFCTVDFSRVEQNEGIMKAVPAALRKKIEEEVQKHDEKFRVKAVIKDRRSPDRLRILCRDEEELKNVKSAAAVVATQGASVRTRHRRPTCVLIESLSLCFSNYC